MIYVVDSQFVFLSAPRDPRTGRTNDFALFGDLKATDISWIAELDEHEVVHWATCPRVPVFLIVTKSKRWRPPAKAAP